MLRCESIGPAWLEAWVRSVQNLALLHPVLPMNFPVIIKKLGRSETSIV